MLDRFWHQYPDGSIIASLLQSDRGRYVVGVTISVAGVPLVSSMAEAETLVAAEDLARDRALSLLPLFLVENGTPESKHLTDRSPEINPEIDRPVLLPASKTESERPKIDRVGKDSDDFARIAFGINTEMNRLGWTKERGRECLVELYNKTSCALLTDDELIGFLRHLEGLVN
jgi:hypothetical protein